MYIHLGQDTLVKKNEIIGIFDLDTATVSGITKKYINEKEKEKKVEYTDFDLPRSFIIVKNSDGEKVKLSRISTAGLRQRIEYDGYYE